MKLKTNQTKLMHCKKYSMVNENGKMGISKCFDINENLKTKL